MTEKVEFQKNSKEVEKSVNWNSRV
jgi:hypothetical protein